MPPPDPDRRVRPAVLVLLLVFFVISGAVVVRISSDAFGQAGGPERAAAEPDLGPTSSGQDEATWHHRDWNRGEAIDAGQAPAPLGDRLEVSMPPPGARLPFDDPQMLAMMRSFQRLGDGGVPLPFLPFRRRARIVDGSGDRAPPGTECTVRVLPVRAGPFSCVVRVLCEGEVLYPNANETAGYVPCEVEDGEVRRAIDDGTTPQDGDPIVRLDLEAGTLQVEDTAPTGSFRARLRVAPDPYERM